MSPSCFVCNLDALLKINHILDTVTMKEKCWKLRLSWNFPSVILKKLTSYLYMVKMKSAAMVDNYSHLKKCADRDISLWLARHRENFWKCMSVPQESAGMSSWEWVPSTL